MPLPGQTDRRNDHAALCMVDKLRDEYKIATNALKVYGGIAALIFSFRKP